MKSPDVVILIHDFAGTGVVRNALRIAAATHHANLATEVWTVTTEGSLVEELPPCIPIRTLGEGRFTRSSRKVRKALAIPALTRALWEKKPKILLSAGNHFHRAASAATLIAGRPDGMRFLGRASNALPRNKLANSLRARLNALKYRSMDQIIAVSSEIAEDLISRGRIPIERITVIPNGVDVAYVTAKSTEPTGHDWFDRPDAPVIVGAGRLVRQKNFALLIEAFAKLNLKTRRPVRLAILGDGPPKASADLAALSQRLGCLEDVVFTGFVANPYAYLAKADIVAIPSLWEGASNVLIEAMACGTNVVVASTATGAAEVLDNSRFGAIVPRPGPETFARALEDTLDYPKSADLLQSRARDYDLSYTLAAYVDLFRQELEFRSHPRLPTTTPERSE